MLVRQVSKANEATLFDESLNHKLQPKQMDVQVRQTEGAGSAFYVFKSQHRRFIYPVK